jgi:hypothetical protein
MRVFPALAIATMLSAAFVNSAQAMVITARVSGGAAPVHAGPDERHPVIGYLEPGAEILVDYCTQVDRESRHGGIGDAGHPLWGSSATRWCRIPDLGWVERNDIVGRGLSTVTPPDFAGPGW